MKEKQKWLRLDADDGWQVVIPETDIKPHGFPEGKQKASLAWLDCPCKPRVDALNKIIVHNSFEDKKLIDDAMGQTSSVGVDK